jgi:hypothetical protein
MKPPESQGYRGGVSRGKYETARAGCGGMFKRTAGAGG